MRYALHLNTSYNLVQLNENQYDNQLLNEAEKLATDAGENRWERTYSYRGKNE